MLTQSQIDHQSRKKYFVVLPQIRNSVSPSYSEKYVSDRRWGYLFSGLFLLGAVMFVLAFEFNFIEYVF